MVVLVGVGVVRRLDVMWRRVIMVHHRCRVMHNVQLLLWWPARIRVVFTHTLGW